MALLMLRVDGYSQPDTTEQSAEHSLGRPIQPRRTSTRATSPAVRHGCVGDVGPAVPQRDAPVRRRGVVPPDVAPARIISMGQPPIEFDHQPVPRVEGIPVLGAPSADHARLAAGAGQAVRPLHVPVVTELQHAVQAANRISQHRSQQLTPAQPAPRRHGRPELVLRGEPAPAGPGHPAERIVERVGLRGQVQHGVLDPGPRRPQARVPDLIGVGGGVDDQPGEGPDPSAGRHGQVQRLSGPVDEMSQLRRALVAEHGVAAASEHRRPQRRLPAGRPAGQHVHTAVRLLPALAAQLPGQRGLGQPGRHRLLAGDHAGLRASQLAQRLRNLGSHPASLAGHAAKRGPRWQPAVDKCGSCTVTRKPWREREALAMSGQSERFALADRCGRGDGPAR